MIDYDKLATITNGMKNTPFGLKIQTLENKIKYEAEKSKYRYHEALKSTSYDKDEQIFITKNKMEYMRDLSEIKIEDMEDYDFVSWLYNNGSLRSDEEIAQKTEEMRVSKIKNSEEYNKGYHPFGVFLGTLLLPPFILAFCDGMNTIDAEDILYIIPYTGIMGTFSFGFAFIPLIIIACVVTLIYCKSHAEEFNVPMDSEIVGAVIGATVAGCASYYFSGKADRKRTEGESSKKI